MRLVPRATVTEVYAWTTTRLSHCQEQRDHDSRDPRDYCVVHLLAGPVIDTTVLFGTPCAVPAANPALLGLAFRPTDRRRPPLSVAALDVYSLYQHGLSYRWAIPRTLDLTHPASATSTSFSHLLTASDSTISAVRLSICKASHHNAMHGRQLAHALYLTVQDARPLGNNRCMKVGPTHTHCDICFAIDGVLRRETARHVTHECPRLSSTPCFALLPPAMLQTEPPSPPCPPRNSSPSLNACTPLAQQLTPLSPLSSLPTLQAPSALRSSSAPRAMHLAPAPLPLISHPDLSSQLSFELYVSVPPTLADSRRHLMTTLSSCIRASMSGSKYMAIVLRGRTREGPSPPGTVSSSLNLSTKPQSETAVGAAPHLWTLT